MAYSVVLRRNGANVGHFGPFGTKKQAIAQGQVLADDAARDVVVSVEPQRKTTTAKKRRTNTRTSRTNTRLTVGQKVKLSDIALALFQGRDYRDARGKPYDESYRAFVQRVESNGYWVRRPGRARSDLDYFRDRDLIAFDSNTRKARTNTRRTNPTVPDVWGLPPKYGSTVVQAGDYKKLPLPPRVNTELYYEARSSGGGVATLTVKKKSAASYHLHIAGERARFGNAKEAREDIQYFLESGRLPARRNPSRGAFKSVSKTSKPYTHYTVNLKRRLLTSGHKSLEEALKQASTPENVMTALQAQKYLGRRSDGHYRSLTSSASWYNRSH